MAGDFFIPGGMLISVVGRSDSFQLAMPSSNIPTQLGLAIDKIEVTFDISHEELRVNAYGKNTPEVQCMGGAANVRMDVVHFDPEVLEACWRESQGGSPQIGMLSWAGALLGNSLPQFTAGGVAGNHFISLNLKPMNPTGNSTLTPYHFPYCYLQTPPHEIPLGSTYSLMRLNWRAIPYVPDPYNRRILNGIQLLGSYGATVYDHNLDGSNPSTNYVPDVS